MDKIKITPTASELEKWKAGKRYSRATFCNKRYRVHYRIKNNAEYDCKGVTPAGA